MEAAGSGPKVKRHASRCESSTPLRAYKCARGVCTLARCPLSRTLAQRSGAKCATSVGSSPPPPRLGRLHAPRSAHAACGTRRIVVFDLLCSYAFAAIAANPQPSFSDVGRRLKSPCLLELLWGGGAHCERKGAPHETRSPSRAQALQHGDGVGRASAPLLATFVPSMRPPRRWPSQCKMPGASPSPPGAASLWKGALA